MRRVIVGLVAVALAVGVVALWPRSTSDDPPSTTVEAPTTTSSPAPTSTSTTSTSLPATTTTVPPETNVVETVEEAEAILRELWFGWFEGIYNQDEDRIREVVATEHQVRLATEQFGVMQFERQPRPTDISYAETQILHATSDCTVVTTEATIDGFMESTSTDVHVLRWDGKWLFFSLWAFSDDLWEADCEAQLG